MPAHESTPPTTPPARLPVHSRQATAPPVPGSTGDLGLLEYVTAHAVDDDYASLGKPGRSTRARTATLVVIALFVVLLITAATQTSRNAVSDSAERADLGRQVSARRDELAAQQNRIDGLSSQISGLNTALSGNAKLSGGTRARLNLLGIAAGATTVRGPGVVVTVDNAVNGSGRAVVLDTDLQQLVNGLWRAGAEAIGINGERITSLTAIRQAGQAITVNYADLSRPYVVSAIGNPATLAARFAATPNGQTWLDLHQQLGLRFDVIVVARIDLPGAQANLRVAQVMKGNKR